jgi:hypothetical protein
MIRLLRFAIALGLIVGAASCTAAPPQTAKVPPTEGYGGTWVMNLGTRTFMVLTLEKTGDTFTGTLTHPEKFQTANGVRFSHVNSGVATETVVSAAIQGNMLHFTTSSAGKKDDTTEYDMTLVSQDSAFIQFTGMPLQPLPFSRVRDTSPRTVFTDWEPRRSYSLDDNAASSPEMQQIFEADQAARKDFVEFSRAGETVAAGDVERRSQTRRLLADGKLRTGEDYTRAAFVFQHGATPDDILFAHTLAMVAAAKGDEEALWIASATLDRYLHSTGKRQIFGTQIKEKADHTATLEPYNRELVDDVIRRELGVQPIAVQEEQLPNWTERFRTAAASPK